MAPCSRTSSEATSWSLRGRGWLGRWHLAQLAHEDGDAEQAGTRSRVRGLIPAQSLLRAEAPNHLDRAARPVVDAALLQRSKKACVFLSRLAQRALGGLVLLLPSLSYFALCVALPAHALQRALGGGGAGAQGFAVVLVLLHL